MNGRWELISPYPLSLYPQTLPSGQTMCCGWFFLPLTSLLSRPADTTKSHALLNSLLHNFLAFIFAIVLLRFYFGYSVSCVSMLKQKKHAGPHWDWDFQLDLPNNLNWDFVLYLGGRRPNRFLSDLYSPHEKKICGKSGKMTYAASGQPGNPRVTGIKAEIKLCHKA